MARMTLAVFAEQMSAALGPRLVSLLLYGSAARQPANESREQDGMNTLLLVDRADGELFALLTTPVRGWIAANHPPPLVLTEREWRDSADAFPIEYEDIREAHRVLAGRDPWHGIRVQREHVRRQLEHELMGKLVHLRQAYAAEWNNPRRLREVIDGTRAGFLTMLRAVLRLEGRAVPGTPDALVREAGSLIGFPAADRWTEPAAYLDAVTRTAEYVNRMERKPS
ncbi:MAG TPA: hypothetical protein VFM23_09780 [Gemmatimonadales bacterium]|nr:hypothetical protein [Gemmatimonadales bacterium]